MASSSPDQKRLRVAIVGLGGIGGGAAGFLNAAARYDVTICVRRPLTHFTLEHPGGTIEGPVHALTDPAPATPADWVLVCTKTHETPSAAAWLARLCTPATRVAVLQNGIDHAERVGPLANGARIVPVIVYYNGERLAPDRVRFRPVGPHELAVADGDDGRAFAQLMQGTPLRVSLSGDFTTVKWRKLLLNAAANPITALTMQRQAVLRHPDVYAQCLAILGEAVRVARADGAEFSNDEPQRAMDALMTYAPELGTSMYFDRMAGRPFEIEALTGAIVRAGERHAIPTPLNGMLLALMRAIGDAMDGHTVR